MASRGLIFARTGWKQVWHSFVIDTQGSISVTASLAILQLLITAGVTADFRSDIWNLSQNNIRMVISKHRQQIAQNECLARAIYFEARSETELGQLAVAKVILNRVEHPKYPNNICGVVYQGSKRRNACQFSFACDGKSDDPRHKKAWTQARWLASRAVAGDKQMHVVSTATHYHADYVTPKWSSAMDRLVKIGRHIFYNSSL